MPNRGRGRRGVLGGQGVGRGVDTGDPGGPIPGDRELPGGADKPEWGKDWREVDLGSRAGSPAKPGEGSPQEPP